MSDKVVFEGLLSSWQSSPLHVGISVNDPMLEGDFAPLSGRRVRVTVEAIAPEPRCPHCGGKVYITQVLGNDQLLRYMAGCNCGAHGEGPTRQAALDALAEYLAPCPRCGGKAEYVQFMSVGRILAKCACGLQSPVFTDKPKTAQWWNKRAP